MACLLCLCGNDLRRVAGLQELRESCAAPFSAHLGNALPKTLAISV